MSQELRAALHALLDAVDYTRGACSMIEAVGAVLPVVLIENARQALAEVEKAGMTIRVEPDGRGRISPPAAMRVVLQHEDLRLEAMNAQPRADALRSARRLGDTLGLREIPRGVDQSDDYTVHFMPRR